VSSNPKPMPVDMRAFYDKAEKWVEHYHQERAADIHWSTCEKLCNIFEVWDNDAFPMWVMYIVGGIMRERGL